MSRGRVCSAWIKPWLRCYVSVMAALVSIIGPESYGFGEGVVGCVCWAMNRNARNEVLESVYCSVINIIFLICFLGMQKYFLISVMFVVVQGLGNNSSIYSVHLIYLQTNSCVQSNYSPGYRRIQQRCSTNR